jgi:hypothetical protein
MTRGLLLAAALVVSAVTAAAQETGAKVIYQVGQVSIADGGYFKALSVGDTIKLKQLIVTGPDGYARFEVLSDHSTFEVFSNARVWFRDIPGSWQNLLNVLMGRVKVFIQHAPGIPNSNRVTSPTAVVSVRGTIFDVIVESADGTTYVTVDEGIVDVRNWTAPGPSVTLRANESVRVYPGQPLVAKQVDKGDVFRRLLYAMREAAYQIAIQGPSGRGGPIAGGPGTVPANGDKGPDSGSSGGPGAPPAGPGAPPPGPGK